MDLVHDRGSMDPVHESGPWTRSKVRVHGPLVHVLSSPLFSGVHKHLLQEYSKCRAYQTRFKITHRYKTVNKK